MNRSHLLLLLCIVLGAPAARAQGSDADAIRRHIARYWNVPIGAQPAENLVVDVRVVVAPDGTVREATTVDQARYGNDPAFRRWADSAIHAVRRASPLPPPAGREHREFIISFDPRSP